MDNFDKLFRDVVRLLRGLALFSLFTLSACGGGGESKAPPVAINTPPSVAMSLTGVREANASGVINATKGAQIVFSESPSADPDGDVLTFS